MYMPLRSYACPPRPLSPPICITDAFIVHLAFTEEGAYADIGCVQWVKIKIRTDARCVYKDMTTRKLERILSQCVLVIVRSFSSEK